MILKCESLPLRLHDSRAHAAYVTVLEDNQPELPGVSQNVGCTRLLSHPATHLPTQPWSRRFVSAAVLSYRRAREGCWMTWVTSTCFEGGWQSKYAHIHTLSYCTVLTMRHPPLHITHTHTHTHTALHTLRPPVVALATPRQIQTFPLKAEPKPTTIVCCWILWGAFRSCQFVQVGMKKTSWPT